MFRTTSNFDFVYTDHGTVGLLQPVSEAARAWLEEHVEARDWQYIGTAVAIDPRRAGPIILDIIVDGGLNVGMTAEPVRGRAGAQ